MLNLEQVGGKKNRLQLRTNRIHCSDIQDYNLDTKKFTKVYTISGFKVSFN